MIKRMVITVLSVLMISSALTACNTVRGVGEDISAGGKAIQRSAK
ncbi:MAG: hypothetical protein XXXJIFNMEKO3_02615 [Candidatus Erwinia impunctatus]|nr:hypothetical protein XXXJIFNMEKO_02615 [Culicoides impunctatus]